MGGRGGGASHLGVGGSLVRLLQHYTSLNYFSVGGGSSIYQNVRCKHNFSMPGGRGLSPSVLTYSMPMQESLQVQNG